MKYKKMEENKDSFILFLLREFNLKSRSAQEHDLSPEISELKKYTPAEIKQVIEEYLSDEQPMPGADWDDMHSQAWKEQYIKHYRQAIELGDEAVRALKIEKKKQEPRLRKSHELLNIMPRHHSNWFAELAVGASIALVFAVMLSVFAPQTALKSLDQIDKMVFAPIEKIYAYINMPEDIQPFKVAGVDKGLDRDRKSAIIQAKAAKQPDAASGRVLGAVESREATDTGGGNTILNKLAEWQIDISQKLSERIIKLLVE